MMTEIVLRPDEMDPTRPFTSPDRYERDSCVLTSMVEDLRALMISAAAGTVQIIPHKSITWRVHGLKRRVIVCNPAKLAPAADLFAVGFIAQRRQGIDPGPLERANSRVVKEFVDYPGILSYSSWELANNDWANLVLNEDEAVADRWRASAAHAKAVNELSPQHYRNVVIHHGQLPGGLPGGRWVTIDRTRYLDFTGAEMWRATRERRPTNVA